MNDLKILVVDDESRMRKLVKDFLNRAGYQVLEAGDGEEAVDVFFSTKGIDLLVLDVMMPRMDGWEVVREIRKVSEVPIIMLTAKDQENDELQGFDLGVDEYILEAFQSEDFSGKDRSHFKEDQTAGRRSAESRRDCSG